MPKSGKVIAQKLHSGESVKDVSLYYNDYNAKIAKQDHEVGKCIISLVRLLCQCLLCHGIRCFQELGPRQNWTSLVTETSHDIDIADI